MVGGGGGGGQSRQKLQQIRVWAVTQLWTRLVASGFDKNIVFKKELIE